MESKACRRGWLALHCRILVQGMGTVGTILVQGRVTGGTILVQGRVIWGVLLVQGRGTGGIILVQGRVTGGTILVQGRGKVGTLPEPVTPLLERQPCQSFWSRLWHRPRSTSIADKQIHNHTYSDVEIQSMCSQCTYSQTELSLPKLPISCTTAKTDNNKIFNNTASVLTHRFSAVKDIHLPFLWNWNTMIQKNYMWVIKPMEWGRVKEAGEAQEPHEQKISRVGRELQNMKIW